MRALRIFLPEPQVPRRAAAVSRLLLMYFAWSLITLPIMGKLWFGEIPPLALVQGPKIAVASWCRGRVVMPLIKKLGMSSGSFSPDYLKARPWGLLAFHLPLALWAIFVMTKSSWGGRERFIGGVLLVVIVADYGATLALAGGPGFSIY